MDSNEVVICLNCGYENSADSKFCSNCGNKLNPEEKIMSDPKINQSYTSSEDNSTRDNDISNFIQENISYYKEKFTIIKQTNNKISWNWSSFFFGAYWALYRKMYAIALAIIAVVFILSFVPFIKIILWIATPIFMGMYGNYIYLKFIDKKLEEVNYLSGSERDSAIVRNGGVNIIVPIVIIAATAIIFIIFFLLFATIGSMMYFYL